MTLQEAPVHTSKIRLHWIELMQTLEDVIYRWDTAYKNSHAGFRGPAAWSTPTRHEWVDHLKAVTVGGSDVYMLSREALEGGV